MYLVSLSDDVRHTPSYTVLVHRTPIHQLAAVGDTSVIPLIAQDSDKALKIVTIGTGIYLLTLTLFKTYATREWTWLFIGDGEPCHHSI